MTYVNNYVSFGNISLMSSKTLSQAPVIQKLVDDFVNRSPMRTTSLIVTLFGDVVSQHGGTIWLGSLVKALELMGVNERLVRTSVFRLVKEGWLEAERVGRRSYYRFSPLGLHEYERAAIRIYALESHKWQGRWQVLIPLDIADKQRDTFKRSLQWQGFRNITPGVFAKPEDDNRQLLDTLKEYDAVDKIMLLEAETAAISSGKTTRQLVHDCWELDKVAASYRDFLKRYKPLQRWLTKNTPDPESALVARTLLIHDHRRILLHDTPLPESLLPRAWQGAEALRLAAECYNHLAAPSMEYITGNLESGNGGLPQASAGFRQRFSQLDRG